VKQLFIQGRDLNSALASPGADRAIARSRRA
jgi:hypothetical protein